MLPVRLEMELNFAFRRLAREKLEDEANRWSSLLADDFRDRLRARIPTIQHECMQLFERHMNGVITEAGSSGPSSAGPRLRVWIEEEIKETLETKVDDLTWHRRARSRAGSSTRAQMDESIGVIASADIRVDSDPLPDASQRVATLSKRDADMHHLIGKNNFCTLTNIEIMNDASLKKVLREQFQLKPGEDATKCCLDRIRRAKGYPLSRKVRQRR